LIKYLKNKGAKIMPKKNIFRYTALLLAIAFVALPAKLIYAASVSGSGSAMISTGSSAGNTLTVSMTGVTSPTGSMKYNAYLLDDSMKKTSVGNVSVDEDGVAKLSYTSDSDIMINFRRLEIREESGASSRIIFANTIPGQDVKNIRALVGKDSEITALQNVLNNAISHATNGKNAKTTADLVISAKKMMDVVNGDVGNGVAAHVKLASEAITKAMGTNITGSYVYDSGTTANSAITVIQSNADAAVLSAQQAQTFKNFETGSILMNDALNSLLRAKNLGTVIATKESYKMGSFKLSKLDDIYTTIKNDTRLTKLSSAINTAGMSSDLSAIGPMTLLAPTDTAITSYGDANWSKLSNNSANLKRALEVHILDSHLLSGDSKIDTRIMDSNRAKYTATDIEASNGIIHLVDTVIARRGPFPGLPSVGAYDTNVLNVAYGMLALGIMLITISGLVRLNYRKNI
jgi:uncharacterized surface protein with fasciclin (FAS1) repeats